MSWTTLWWFFVSTFLISAAPGPNMLLAFQHGLNFGLRRTLATLAGLSTGLLLLLVLSLVGLSALSRHPALFNGAKCLGAAYLLHLAWRAFQSTSGLNSQAIEVNGQSPLKLFRTGLGVSLSNPKAILFFAAFFPKFIHTGQALMPQYLALTLTFFMIETFWQILYTVSGKSLAAWLQQGQRLLWLNRVCALVFALIALLIIQEAWRGFQAA